MQIDGLVDLLRDGHYHSGNAMAVELGVTRARIWQMIQHLQAMGLPIWSVRGRGYRVAPEVSLLQRQRVTSELQAVQHRLESLQIVTDINSTNAALLGAVNGTKGYAVLSSEYQSAGRGRHGKDWLTPMASNLACSLALAAVPLHQLPALSVAIGLALAQMLRAIGIDRARVKWPNDIFIDDAKVAGVLVELRPREDSHARLVIGVGMNVNHSFAPTTLGRTTTHINAHLTSSIDRNDLLALLITTVIQAVDRHLQQGLSPVLTLWPALDYLQGKWVTVVRGVDQLSGWVQGIDAHGRLRVDCDGEPYSFDHGEVQVGVR